MPKPPAREWRNDPFLLTMNYPHMLPTEREMFRFWLKTQGRSFDSFMFDVLLGAGRPSSQGTLDEIEKNWGISFNLPQKEKDFIDGVAREWWRGVTSKKVDAIGFRGNETWLIEVKRHAGMGLLGQLDVYTRLLLTSSPPDGPFFRLAIVGEVDNDVFDLFQERNIILIQVPVPSIGR